MGNQSVIILDGSAWLCMRKIKVYFRICYPKTSQQICIFKMINNNIKKFKYQKDETTWSLSCRIAHQKSHADVLRSSIGEYSTEKSTSYWGIIQCNDSLCHQEAAYSLRLNVHIAMDSSSRPDIWTNFKSHPCTNNPWSNLSPALAWYDTTEFKIQRYTF